MISDIDSDVNLNLTSLRLYTSLSLDKTTFTALTSTEGGDLNTSDFATINASTNAALVAGASSARIVFNEFNGDLFYNENGVTAGLGSGGLFANLSGLTSLSGSDFIVQA